MKMPSLLITLQLTRGFLSLGNVYILIMLFVISSSSTSSWSLFNTELALISITCFYFVGLLRPKLRDYKDDANAFVPCFCLLDAS